MLSHPPQRLPENVHMPCYACEEIPATHVCRFQVGELAVQVCLCEACMKIDTTRLLKNTIGIQGLAEKPAANYLVENPAIAMMKA